MGRNCDCSVRHHEPKSWNPVGIQYVSDAMKSGWIYLEEANLF